MTFYYQRKGTKEQEEILNQSKEKMDKYYNEYNNTYKTLMKEERISLWNKYLEARKEVEINFKPFGFIC